MKLEDLINPTPINIELEIPEYIRYDSEIVGYPDLEMQHQIYRWALEDVNTFGKTFIDVGAGRGDIFTYLFDCKSYIGFELKDFLCTSGKELNDYASFNLLNINYLDAKLGQDADIGLLIGTLNSINTSDKWQMFLNYFNKMYDECTERCIFIINSYSDDDHLNGFPFDELFTNVLLNKQIPFKIDYSKYEDIYKLTVFK